MGTLLTQSSVNMFSLLVLAAVSAVADEAAVPSPLAARFYGGYGLGHGLGYAGYPYAVGPAVTYTPQLINYVPKEVEIPVKHLEYAVKKTGCTNVFGFDVPCLAEGEARRKRSADEAAPAAVPAVLPFGYGYGHGLGFGYGLGHGLGYAGVYGHGFPAVTVAEPKVTDVEVPHYVYKPVVEKIDLAPACFNGHGFAVPCA